MAKSSFDSCSRPLVVKPRRRGFVHHPIISVIGDTGVTEEGEVIRNLPLFAYNSEAHIWVTLAPTDLARIMRDYFGTYVIIDNQKIFEYPWFCLGATNSVDPDPDFRQMGVPKGRINSFGFHSKYYSAPKRKTGRHIIYHPATLLGNRKRAHELVENNHGSLQKLVQDIREWCKEQDLPMSKTLSGIGSALLRDKRFWPYDRGRVPRATNERVRPYLPAVHNELYGNVHKTYDKVVALDQRRAYHTIAREVPTPDPTTLFARGFFRNPGGEKMWTNPGKPVYERTVRQPGLLAVKGSSRPTRSGEIRLPALDFQGTKVIYLWSNELDLARQQDFSVEGLTAAWTSRDSDRGLPLYGKWAIEQIDKSSTYRRQWLKPALHSTYGLLGSRPRTMQFLEYNGHGEDIVTWYFAGYYFEFTKRELENWLPEFANATMLGVLQAEVRNRTFSLATQLQSQGADILHSHADGLHLVIDQLPLDTCFSGNRWTVDQLTRLRYEDKVSYVSNERYCLPGRDTRQRIETRRRYAQLVAARKDALCHAM